MEAAGPGQLELIVIDWFKEWIGYPAEAAGVLVSGGSAANLTALACARECARRGDARRTWSSTPPTRRTPRSRERRGRSASDPEQLRVLPTDDEFRMRPDALEGAIAADREAGLDAAGRLCQRRLHQHRRDRPAAGAGRDLPPARRLAARRRRVRRVRGADRARPALAGRDRAGRLGDARSPQVALPALRVRLPARPRGASARGGLPDRPPTTSRTSGRGSREVNFSDRGLQLSRMARSLKVWLSINDIRRRRLPRRDRSTHSTWRSLAQERVEAKRRAGAAAAGEARDRLLPPPLRRWPTEERGRGAEPQAGGRPRSGAAMGSSPRPACAAATRSASASSTMPAARADVRGVLEWLEQADVDEADVEPEATAAEPRADRHRDLSGGWATGRDATPRGPRPAALRGPERGAARRASPSTRGTARAEPGEEVTTRWSAGREFYVILDGRAEVDCRRRGGP